ncbi:hypothetical protein B0H16DRAFT_1773273 [Mycena metata]|uniref:Uncharacterized protein n=1 Tax=Mycena metata TaxID=1033252 RepID=A0AAD7HZP8_9AGAR|nr:hypothetical protein B0H16DRAFT_1773273 [Mycena metata]
MSSQPPSPPTTPHNELLELTHKLTPSKTPRALADISNQLGNAPPPRKRRFRHSRATAAENEVENPNNLEERVRDVGRLYAIQYPLFLSTDAVALFATPLDPAFKEATEFATKKSRIQGQLRDIIDILPNDAKDFTIRKHEWVARCFEDGLSGQRSNCNTRIRQDSATYIAANTTFKDLSQNPPANISVNIEDLNSSSSRFNAFAERIGYQEATSNGDAFYSPLKAAEVLFKDYDGTMNPSKIFRGPALLSGLFQGESKLPSARVIERQRHIVRSVPGAIVNSAVLAIWFYSADTQLLSEGDETKINYKQLAEAFMRQICEGMRDNADWVKGLFRYWDDIIFPHADNSHSHTLSDNHKAVCDEIDAMDAAFKAATVPRVATPPYGPSQPSSPQTAPSRRDTSQSPYAREDSPESNPAPSTSRHHRGHHNTSRRGGSQSSHEREDSPEPHPAPSTSHHRHQSTSRRGGSQLSEAREDSPEPHPAASTSQQSHPAQLFALRGSGHQGAAMDAGLREAPHGWIAAYRLVAHDARALPWWAGGAG